MTSRFRRSPRWHALTCTLSVFSIASVLLISAPSHTAFADDIDPELEQEISGYQELATDEAVLGIGHVDVGPKYVDGEWVLLIHDDTQLAGSVWRHADRTALQVSDAAVQAVPDSEAFAFLGLEPGTEVHVLPQTQDPDVVWVGWNTQDPEVMNTIVRGATLSLEAVEGPGELFVYLNDGSFGEPQVLWQTPVAEPQPLWIDVNTHTHANWVFTEPGIYLVHLEMTADLQDGGTASARDVLRFSIGDSTDPSDALNAEAQEVGTADSSSGTAEEPNIDATGNADSDTSWWTVAVIGGLAVLLTVIVVVSALSARRARRQANDK